MGLVEAVKSGFVNAFVLRGRASRSEVWFFWLFCFLVNIVLIFAMGLMGGAHSESQSLGVVYLLFSLVTAVPSTTVAIRRFHDIGLSGWWYLVVIIPFLGALWLLYCMIKKGEPGGNRFGPNPLGEGDEPQDAVFADGKAS